MRIYVGNLARKITDREFEDVALLFGKPESALVARQASGDSKGFGFAVYSDDDEARAAIEGFHGRSLGGNVLWASEASAGSFVAV